MFSSNTSQVSDEKLYSEDVFSTYLYTGTGAAQTITNGIDLAGKGGMVWIKSRSAATNNFLFDTTRGVNVELNSNTTDANATLANSVTAFNSNGFAISSATGIGVNAATYASWTFREAPNFFDVVTYTGTGANRTIAHNLGVAPGCILVKRTDNIADWQVYHRSNANTEYMVLNTTAAKATGTTRWNSTTPTATEFTVGTDATVNASGGTYVAYLFAHDATSDGIIQCGSYTGNGSTSGPVVNLGWEPQWLLVKEASNLNDWQIIDNMRGWPDGRVLYPNLGNAEDGGLSGGMALNATGFQPKQSWTAINRSGSTYIYIAIRRGPMKTPTLGTSVFAINNNVSSDATKTTSGIVTDLFLERPVKSGANPFSWVPRLTRGYMDSNSTAAENVPGAGYFAFDYMDGFLSNLAGNINPGLFYSFKRAPGFFDEVCYTGTGSARTVNHNLGVAPELMIFKKRSDTSQWYTLFNFTKSGSTEFEQIYLNLANGSFTSQYSNPAALLSAAPTTSVFSLSNDNTVSVDLNDPGATYVAYLFASCPGVSKVGSYTGNGSSQTINCGFAAGARFVMIKRTDSTGDWYVWDTARGIVAANDPHLSLNTTAAEVTTDDTIDTDSSGFVVNQVAATNVNVSSATYIYLAIA